MYVYQRTRKLKLKGSWTTPRIWWGKKKNTSWGKQILLWTVQPNLEVVRDKDSLKAEREVAFFFSDTLFHTVCWPSSELPAPALWRHTTDSTLLANRRYKSRAALGYSCFLPWGDAMCRRHALLALQNSHTSAHGNHNARERSSFIEHAQGHDARWRNFFPTCHCSFSIASSAPAGTRK